MLRFPFFSTKKYVFICNNIFGDIMIKKYIIPTLLALLTGLILGRFVLNQYEFEGKIIPTIGTNKQAYFIQQGVYSSKESMQNNATSFPYYIYMQENDKYYVYIGITFLEENMDKIKGYYEQKGYTTYVKRININNNDFITVLEQYDILLNETTDSEVVGTVCSQVLNKYEELVLKGDS